MLLLLIVFIVSFFTYTPAYADSITVTSESLAHCGDTYCNPTYLHVSVTCSQHTINIPSGYIYAGCRISGLK